MFKDKVLLITGGTGSFGNAVLRRFLDTDIKEISQKELIYEKLIGVSIVPYLFYFWINFI